MNSTRPCRNEGDVVMVGISISPAPNALQERFFQSELRGWLSEDLFRWEQGLGSATGCSQTVT